MTYLQNSKAEAMNKKINSLLVVLLVAVACQSPDKKTPNEDTSSIITESTKARIDSTLKSFVDSGKAVGVSALIFEKNKEAYFNAFGSADREDNTIMDRNTIVRIY